MNKLKIVYTFVMLGGFILDMFNSIVHYFSKEYTAAIWWLLFAIFVYEIFIRTMEELDD